jgi:hypothetical protein
MYRLWYALERSDMLPLNSLPVSTKPLSSASSVQCWRTTINGQSRRSKNLPHWLLVLFLLVAEPLRDGPETVKSRAPSMCRGVLLVLHIVSFCT